MTYNVRVIAGGNASLKPETSENVGFGIIIEPKQGLLQGLRLSVDYADVKKTGAISTLTDSQIVSNQVLFPGRITRDPTTNLITIVDTSFVNLFLARMKAFNWAFNYRRQTEVGTFELSDTATVIEHLQKQAAFKGPLLEYVGYSVSGGPIKTRNNTTLSWRRKQLSVAVTSRWTDSYKQVGIPGDPRYSGAPLGSYTPLTTYYLAQGSFTIPSQIYFDLFASWNFGPPISGHGLKNWTEGLTFSVGLHNLLNKIPPFDAYYDTPSYYSPYGNPRLRDFWVSVKKDF